MFIKACSRHHIGCGHGAIYAQKVFELLETAGRSRAKDAMDDCGGSFIMVTHLVKLTEAARDESHTSGSRLRLAAAARFVHSPRGERFAAVAAAESLDFASTGRPPTRSISLLFCLAGLSGRFVWQRHRHETMTS